MIVKQPIAVAVATLGLTAVGLCGNAYAGNFTTTLNLSPANVDSIDKIVFNFSTNLTSGAVTGNDLTSWTMQLFAGNTSIFTDNIVSGGTVLPAAVGLTRSIDFAFDIGTLNLTGFDNDFTAARTTATYSGVFYNAFPVSANTLMICKNTNGGLPDDNQDGTTCTPTSSFTQQTSENVPEPASIFGLLVASGAGLLTIKRQKQEK